MTPRWGFLQLSRDVPSDFVTLLSERVTYNDIYIYSYCDQRKESVSCVFFSTTEVSAIHHFLFFFCVPSATTVSSKWRMRVQQSDQSLIHLRRHRRTSITGLFPDLLMPLVTKKNRAFPRTSFKITKERIVYLRHYLSDSFGGKTKVYYRPITVDLRGSLKKKPRMTSSGFPATFRLFVPNSKLCTV